MPYPFNQTLIFFDHVDQAVQLVGSKANILCQRHRIDPELCRRIAASDVNMWRLAWVTFVWAILWTGPVLWPRCDW